MAPAQRYVSVHAEV